MEPGEEQRPGTEAGPFPGVAVLAVDAAGLVTFAEGACAEAYGVSAERLLGQTLDELDLAPSLVNGFRDARRGDGIHAVTRGPHSLFEHEFVPRRGGGALDVARPIQEESQAFGSRSVYLSALMSQVPAAVWTTDRDLRITHATGSALANARMKSGIHPCTRLQDIVGTEDPTEPVVAHHLAALAGVEQSFRYTFEGRAYQVVVRPLRDLHDHVVGCIGAAVDVTERVALESELSRATRRLEDAQRVAHIGSFEWDIATNVVTWSKEMHRIYGLEPGSFRGSFESFMERVHRDDVELTRAAVFDAYRQQKPLAYDHRVVLPDGRVRTLRTRGEVLLDEAGRPVRLVGSCWDITDVVEAAMQRERSISLLHATLEATADGILVVDQEGKIAASNQRFLSMWKVSAAMIARQDDRTMLAHAEVQLEDPRGFRAKVEELYARPEQESFDVLRFRDGRVYERYSMPQRLGGEIVGRVWSFRDVSERERLLGRATFLADAARLLGSLDAETALDGVAHMAIPYLGDACAVDLLGEGGPRRLLVVCRDPTHTPAPELHRAALLGHATVYPANGLSHIAAPLVVNDDVVGVITFSAPKGRTYSTQDVEVVEELARRAALSVQNARLYRGAREALRTRDEFLTVAAHEIRGPVAAIHLAVQTLRRFAGPSFGGERLFEILEREDRRLGRFVNELLDVARFQTGKLNFVIERVDLCDVVRVTATRLRDELARSGSSLSVTSDQCIAGQWDRFRLEEVVTSLLSNAVKFGMGRPIEISVTSDGKRARLVIRDHGLGMNSEVLQRAFRPFERGVSVRHYGGLGLGLFIVKTIVEGLGGTVRMSSAPSHGTTVTLELPLEPQ